MAKSNAVKEEKEKTILEQLEAGTATIMNGKLVYRYQGETRSVRLDTFRGDTRKACPLVQKNGELARVKEDSETGVVGVQTIAIRDARIASQVSLLEQQLARKFGPEGCQTLLGAVKQQMALIRWLDREITGQFQRDVDRKESVLAALMARLRRS